ncbi:hypothetical protein TRAPUB_5242 [Trametes pubescens]|uniref:Uncharacterized protein n=1 Tax=Trametes pubescens TaxID=154538 RepID=A0A1M2V8X0_TRAPU|nr:hypothetical protein TRAPUB_5242 [Trametes pubescens]
MPTSSPSVNKTAAYSSPSSQHLSGSFLMPATKSSYGHKLTSWSDAEEKLVEILKGGEIPNKVVESSLTAEGAKMISTAGKKMGGITVDREVVSGANPMAATALGNQFINMLKTR